MLITKVLMHKESRYQGFSFIRVGAACRVFRAIVSFGYLVDVFLKVSACLLISSLRNLFISSSILFISESNLNNNINNSQSTEHNFIYSPVSDVVKLRVHDRELPHLHGHPVVSVHGTLDSCIKFQSCDAWRLLCSQIYQTEIRRRSGQLRTLQTRPRNSD